MRTKLNVDRKYRDALVAELILKLDGDKTLSDVDKRSIVQGVYKNYATPRKTVEKIVHG